MNRINKSSSGGLIAIIFPLFTILGVFIVIFTILDGISQGNTSDLLNWLLSHITLITMTIEFPGGITLVVVLTAGGLTISFK